MPEGGLHAHFIFCRRIFLTSSDQINEIQEIARKIIESEGLELIDLEYKEGRTRSLLRIYIDKESGVTLSECESVSRQLSAILDVKDLLNNPYVLEVSSPGLDRPLRTDRDYKRALGRTLKVNLLSDVEGKSEQLTGKLLEVTDDAILIEEGGNRRGIPRNSIKRAVQEVVLGQPKKKMKKR
jgi:ribosome maturation factor RimP